MNKIITIILLVISTAFLVFPFISYYGENLMVVTSDSMIPTLKPYDLIIVQNTEIHNIDVGDIVAFNSHIEEIGIVAHRVVEKFDDNGNIGMFTKGDNINEKDTWTVHEEDLVGKVIDRISFIGILLIEPIRYSLVIIIIIIATVLIKEVISEARFQKKK